MYTHNVKTPMSTKLIIYFGDTKCNKTIDRSLTELMETGP